MELRAYLEILIRRKWVVILTTLATVAAVVLVTSRQQPVYSAAARVRVAQASSGSIEYVDYMYAERLMNTYIEMLKSSSILEEVIKELDLSSSPKDLAKQIEADVVPDTELLSITVTDHDPARAKDIANALATLLVERSRNLYFGGTRSAREILQQQLDEVEAKLEQVRTELQTLVDSVARENARVDALKARIRSEEEVYASLLSQYEQARVAEAARENSVTIVAPAVKPAARDGPQVSYLATATVRVTQPYSAFPGYAEYGYVERLMNTYVELLKTQPILEEVLQKLDLPELPSALLQQIVIEVLPDTELLRITVEDRSPERARDIANALAGLLVEQGQTLYSGDTKSAREILQQRLSAVEGNLEQDREALQDLLDSSARENARIDALEMRIRSEEEVYLSLLRQYEEVRVAEASRESSASIVAQAGQPDAPSKPRVKFNLALGTLVGAVGGIALAFLFEYLDPTLHSTDDLEAAAGASVMGVIPGFAPHAVSRGKILLSSDGRSPEAEAFRMLRGNLLSVASTRPLKTLLITSAEPGAGKSTVLVNLAAAMAQAGQKVVVVDGDLRYPCLHEVFELPNDMGLSNVLSDLRRMSTALQETNIEGVRVLTSGPVPPNPAEPPPLSKLPQLLGKLAKEADLVLLDSPPILAIADAATMASMVDGVLLVAAKDQATGRRVQRALQQMARVGAKPLGVVFNRASAADGDYYYPYGRGIIGGAEPVLPSFLGNFVGRFSIIRRIWERAPGLDEDRSPEDQ